jgi:hypothetical protein
MKEIGPYTIIFALFLMLISGTEAHALRVAVFPVDDLSSGKTSLNQETTELLRHELSSRGLTVLPQEEVHGFMAARRIRQLGMLRTEEILAAHSELQADLVLLGSLCQQSEEAAVLGVSISLIRSSDGKTIWTSSKGVSLVDEQRLLGINAPTTMADLQVILAKELFAGWPVELLAEVGGGEAQASGVREDATVAVDSVLFAPKYVRPGQEVKCTIRFKVCKDSDPHKVFIRVGNRIHLATTGDGVYYQVSWVGSDDKVGQPLRVAMNDQDTRIINGLWNGGPQDAAYPVSLILEWPSGKRQESYLGSYVVDSVAPQVKFKMQGHTLNGVTAFRSELPITPLFMRGEPIVRWEFTIATPQGEVVLQDKGGAQPPEQFVWRGQNHKSQRAGIGLYTISLKVWDRALNQGEARETVQLLAEAPGLDLTLASSEDRIHAQLTAQDGVAIDYWRMELWSADNTMLKTYAGQSLPARVLLPSFANTVDQQKIDCVLTVRDSLGSQTTRKVPHLLAPTAVGGQAAPDQSAEKDKADSGAWQADF